MIEEKKNDFFESFTKLLNGTVKEKSEETKKGESFFEGLKWKLTRIIEEIYKLDFLADDFDLTSFLSTNINFPIERMLEQMDKPWLKDKLTIGLMGHFNTGKTTALNLIFDEKFATFYRENSALATYLTFGKNTKIFTIVDKSGNSQEIASDYSALFDYHFGMRDFPFARIFEYIVKESNNSILNNITFIDTPGLSATIQHSEPTLKVIPNCDAIMWFVKLINGVTESDIKFIKENMGNKSIYVVFSFVDAAQSPDKAISTALTTFKKNGVDVKAHFMLGLGTNVQNDFKKNAIKTLKEIANKYEVYNPYAHIYAIICEFEKFLVEFQKQCTEEFNKLDKSTDEISNKYASSKNTFSSTYSNCISRINNMIDTFNTRCNGAAFCCGASGALANHINGLVSSLQIMEDAYNDIDSSKLVEFGQQASQMNYYDEKIKRSSELLEEIKKMKKIFN